MCANGVNATEDPAGSPAGSANTVICRAHA